MLQLLYPCMICILGKPTYDKRGELVCTKPFPSMPIYFWNDKGNAKYYNAYFAKYKGLFE